MKISVFSPVFGNMSLNDACKFLKSKGVEYLELGCGGYPGTAHADAKVLISDTKKLNELTECLSQNGIKISALSVHGNAIHPDKNIAKSFHDDFVAACKLAKLLKVERIITFSGCAGDKTSSTPNWITCAWPNDFSDLLKWQWDEVLIPYWKESAKIAKENGVKAICFEMHPGFMVYNPETLLKLRGAVGDIICANFDPSHLFWQGIDIVQAIDVLKGAIGFFHAKDTALNSREIAKNGVLDTKSYANERERAWIFRTVGYGHGELEWKNIISALRLSGYNYMLSIEHEDSLMSQFEGLGKAIDFLKNVNIEEDNKTEAWWI